MVACIPSPPGEFTPKETKMSSSNLAVRMEHAATDLLSNPPRVSLRIVERNERPVQSGPRISFTNRKFVIRDQGFRYFLIR
jgi:hypothetical protein